QPQPLPQPATSLQHGIDGEAARQQNGLHTVLSNGHGTPRGVTQPPSAAPTSESRKHPSPVSHRSVGQQRQQQKEQKQLDG
ncbi:hypothetical protein M9458_009907, partial [Cirrhinus mrigala]